VLGGPVNKVLPDLPGTKIQSTVGSLRPCKSNFAGWPPSGKINGQKGADGHCGIINVPSALVFKACWINQLTVKASTTSIPGFQNLELNYSS